MKVALVNPSWSYDRSIYFGCRQPHLPLELGYARALLEAAGHSCLMLDGQLQGLEHRALADAVAAFGPDFTVLTTAPTYLFWRCAPPELRIPRLFLDALGSRGGRTVAIGPTWLGDSGPHPAQARGGSGGPRRERGGPPRLGRKSSGSHPARSVAAFC